MEHILKKSVAYTSAAANRIYFHNSHIEIISISLIIRDCVDITKCKVICDSVVGHFLCKPRMILYLHHVNIRVFTGYVDL